MLYTYIHAYTYTNIITYLYWMKTIPTPMQHHKVFLISPLRSLSFYSDTEKPGSHYLIVLKILHLLIWSVPLYLLCCHCPPLPLHLAWTLTFPAEWLLPRPHFLVETHLVLGLPHLTLNHYQSPSSHMDSLLTLPGPSHEMGYFKGKELRMCTINSDLMKSVICLHRGVRTKLTIFELFLGF